MMTWNDIAAAHPEFVQWIVQKYGPLADGPVEEELYTQMKAEYETELGQK